MFRLAILAHLILLVTSKGWAFFRKGLAYCWRLPLVRLAVIVLLSFCLSCGGAFWFLRKDFHRELAFESLNFVPQSVSPQDLWFSSLDELVTVAQREERLYIDKYRLADSSRGTESVVDLSKIKSVCHLDQGRVIYDGCGSSVQPTLGPQLPSVMVSLSLDGGRAGWACSGMLHISQIKDLRPGVSGSFPVTSVKVGGEGAVSHLRFASDNTVAIFYSSGDWEIADLSRKNAGETGGVLKGDLTVWSHGPVLALSSFATANAFLVHVIDADHFQHYAPFPVQGGAAVAAWDSNEMVIGNMDGSISWWRRDTVPVPSANLPIYLGSKVSAVAFYGENRVLAAGDFDGIYLVEYGRSRAQSRQVLESPSNVTLLVANKNHLAGLAPVVFVADANWPIRFSEEGQWKFNMISFLGTLMGAVLGIISFRKG